MNFILVISNYIFPLITFAYVARTLTVDGLGNVAFAQSVLSYFSYIAILGIPTYGLRECAKVRDDKEKLSHMVQELLIINLISTIVSYVCFAIVLVLVPRFWQNRTLFLIMSLGIVLKTIGVEWLYQALEEYSYITVRSLLVKCVSVVLTFLLIRDSEDYVWYGFLTIFASSASNVCNFIRVRKYISFSRNERYYPARHLKPVFSLFWASIIISVYANFDVVMIGMIKTEREVGLYNVALKIKSLIMVTIMALADVTVSRIAYYHSQGAEEKIVGLAVKTMRLALLITIPVAIYVFFYAENVIHFVCGSQYVEAVSVLRVLTLCVLPLVFTFLFGQQLLIPMGLEKRYTQSVFGGLWINLILNLLMIPSMGAVGAAIGTLVTECWNVYWMGGGINKYRSRIIRNIKFSRYFLSILPGTTASIVVSYIVRDCNVFIQLMLTALTFFGLYYLFALLWKEPVVLESLASLKKLFAGKGVKE